VNRILRLYPEYFIVAIVTLIVMLTHPQIGEFHPAYRVNISIFDILGNVLLFPFCFYSPEFRIVPPTWSVGVEIVNYFILWLLVARRRTNAIVIFLLSSIYHVTMLAINADWTRRYGPFYAALLPFSIGSIIYFSRSFILKKLHTTWILVFVLSFVAWILNVFLFPQISFFKNHSLGILYYLNILFFSIVLSSLIVEQNIRPVSRCLTLLGDLSYPIFLSHWLFGFLVWNYIFNKKIEVAYNLGYAIFPILLFSIIISTVNNLVFKKIRTNIRNAVALRSRA
jgi:peptidoglycan/LPS O-acetylase OafA/YrhL